MPKILHSEKADVTTQCGRLKRALALSVRRSFRAASRFSRNVSHSAIQPCATAFFTTVLLCLAIDFMEGELSYRTHGLFRDTWKPYHVVLQRSSLGLFASTAAVVSALSTFVGVAPADSKRKASSHPSIASVAVAAEAKQGKTKSAADLKAASASAARAETATLAASDRIPASETASKPLHVFQLVALRALFTPGSGSGVRSDVDFALQLRDGTRHTFRAESAAAKALWMQELSAFATEAALSAAAAGQGAGAAGSLSTSAMQSTSQRALLSALQFLIDFGTRATRD